MVCSLILTVSFLLENQTIECLKAAGQHKVLESCDLYGTDLYYQLR